MKNFLILMLTILVIGVGCAKDKKGGKLGKTAGSENDSAAGGLAKVDAKTSDEKSILAIVKKLEDKLAKAESVELYNELSRQVLNTEFRDLNYVPKRKTSRMNSKNSKARKDSSNRRAEAEELLEEMQKQNEALQTFTAFTIKSLDLNWFDNNDGTVQYVSNIEFEDIKGGKFEINEAHKANKPMVIFTPATGNKDIKIEMIYIRQLGKIENVGLLIVKKYLKGKISSITPMLQFYLTGKNVTENSAVFEQLGAFHQWHVFIAPMSNKLFMQGIYEKKTLLSGIYTSDPLPETITFRKDDDSLEGGEIKFQKTNKAQGIKVYLENVNGFGTTAIESFLGIF